MCLHVCLTPAQGSVPVWQGRVKRQKALRKCAGCVFPVSGKPGPRPKQTLAQDGRHLPSAVARTQPLLAHHPRSPFRCDLWQERENGGGGGVALLVLAVAGCVYILSQCVYTASALNQTLAWRGPASGGWDRPGQPALPAPRSEHHGDCK